MYRKRPVAVKEADMAKQDFSGIWHSAYHFTSSRRPGNFDSEYDLTITKNGDKLTLESVPNDEKSHMFVSLRLNGSHATGTWQETTSPDGFYEGMVYEGAAQFAVDLEAGTLVGKWVTYGSDGKVGAGDWEVTRLPEATKLEEHIKEHVPIG